MNKTTIFSRFWAWPRRRSVTEVEVVIGVVIVLALTEQRANEVESEGHPGDAEPHTEGKISDESLSEKALDATVHEVEEPLLSGIWSVMPDVTTSVWRLLVEVLFTVPGTPLLLGDTEAFTVR